MIICSCNALSDQQILTTLHSEDATRPRSPAQAYRCLGCAPHCGRCLVTVRQLLAEARMTNCDVGCAVCPATHREAAHRHAPDIEPVPYLIAAE